MPKISVIVPVYNVEKYLNRCVDSILNQTFEDFELILVNDGSPDNCGNICDEYAQKDNRVKVIHKKNGGVSSARNAGIDTAQGEYIMFVDSDDWINENMLNDMYNMPDSDMKVSSIRMIGKDNSTEYIIDTKMYTQEDLLIGFFSEAFPIICFCGPCCKLYKKDIIFNNAVRFNEDMSLGEDTYFNLNYIKHCKSIYTSEQIYYYYMRENSGSLFTKFRLNMYYDIRKVFDLKVKMANELNMGRDSVFKLKLSYIQSLIGNLIKMVDTNTKSEVKKYMSLLQKDKEFNDDILIKNLKSTHKLINKLISCNLFNTAYLLFFIKLKVLALRKGKQ